MAHTINTKDFNTFSATVIERNLTNHDVVQIYDWLEGADQPIYMRESSKFKDMELIVVIRTTTDADAEVKVNLLISELKKCTIKFDDLPHYYDCHFEGKISKEKLFNGIFKLNISLACYRTRGDQVQVTANKVASTLIDYSGTLPTPVRLTVVPTVLIPSFEITGLSGEPLILFNLAAGSTYVVDGEKYTVTENGASSIVSYPNYEFPILPNGMTTVRFNDTTANVTIQYYPKFY